MKQAILSMLVAMLMFVSTASAKEGTLLVMFGTTYERAQVALDMIESDYRKEYEGKGPVLVAYTSDIIRKKLAKRGQPVLSIYGAMAELAKQGVTDLTMQSFHIAPAQEYYQLERMATKYIAEHPGQFKTVKVGNPLLVSSADLNDTVEIVLNALPKQRKANEAVVLMGHGNNHGHGDLALLAAYEAFQRKDKNVFLANVEGAVNFDNALDLLKKGNYERVWLMPFMIVAGDHAANDLAGPEEDSWASQIKKAGIKTEVNLIGLGEIEGIRKLFLKHTENAITDLVNTKKSIM